MNNKTFFWLDHNYLNHRLWDIILADKKNWLINSTKELTQEIIWWYVKEQLRLTENLWVRPSLWDYLVYKGYINREELIDKLQKYNIKLRIWELLFLAWKLTSVQLNKALMEFYKSKNDFYVENHRALDISFWDFLVENKYISRDVLISILSKNWIVITEKDILLLDWFSKDFIEKLELLQSEFLIKKKQNITLIDILIKNFPDDTMKYKSLKIKLKLYNNTWNSGYKYTSNDNELGIEVYEEEISGDLHKRLFWQKKTWEMSHGHILDADNDIWSAFEWKDSKLHRKLTTKT